MLQKSLSHELWGILKERARMRPREYKFISKTEEGVTVETFEVWVRLKFGRREKKREYHRVVRPDSGAVLYDQLDDVRPDILIKMCRPGELALVPEIRISPERANKLLAEVLDEQRKVDALIAGVKV